MNYFNQIFIHFLCFNQSYRSWIQMTNAQMIQNNIYDSSFRLNYKCLYKYVSWYQEVIFPNPLDDF